MKKKDVTRDPGKAIAYYRVSRDNQSLEQQKDQVRTMCKYKGLELVEEFEDHGISGTKISREGLDGALRAMEEGRAGVLCVAKVDRLGRNTSHLLSITVLAREQGWHLAFKDLDVDTRTNHGEMFFSIMAAMANWERRLISERVKDALAAKRSRGVVGGRRLSIPDELVDLIKRKREFGMTYRQIAESLNKEGWPTPRGGTEWRPSSIQSVLTGVKGKK